MSNLVLIKAVSAGRPRQVRLLLEAGISTENQDDCGQTALVRAIFIGNDRSREKIVKSLLRFGAQVSHADIVGRNALSWACLYGRAKEVDLLLQNADLDLDLNSADMNNQTALYHAATSGSAATVKLMVDALKRFGMSVDVSNSNGVTPLMQAAQLGHDVCASIMIFQGGAKVGLSMNYPEDLDSAERWATKIQRKKDKPVESQFPPIIPQSTLNKIKFYESKAAHMRSLSPFDSDGDDSTTSIYGSEYSYLTDTSIESLTFESSPRAIPMSILALTSADSFVDDDTTRPQIGAKFTEKCHPKREKGGGDFKPTRDLNKMYQYYSDEMTRSYRPPAKAPSPVPTSSEASLSPTMKRAKAKKDANNGKSSKCSIRTDRRRTTNGRGSSLAEDGRVDSVESLYTKVMKKTGGALPNIVKTGVPQRMARENGNNSLTDKKASVNYSDL